MSTAIAHEPVVAGLPDERPSGMHRVELFDRKRYPAATIADRLRDAVDAGTAVAVVAPRPHLDAIHRELAARIDVARHAAAGQLVLIDADDVQRAVRGAAERPDAALDRTLAVPIRGLAERFGRVRVHGELFDLLCRAGDRDAAAATEAWWTRELAALPIELHCAYGVDPATGDPAHAGDRRQLAAIVEVEDVRRAVLERALARSRAAEQHLRDQLAFVERVTAALGGVTNHGELGRVIAGELAPEVGATRCVLSIDGALVAIRGITTPDDPAALARGLDAEPAGLADRPGARVGLGDWVCVHPVVVAGRRRGTLVLGLGGPPAATHGARAAELTRQLALAIARADQLALARHDASRGEAALVAYDQLLARFGHELRNPLAPLMTATQLMRLRAPGTFARERSTIERAAGQLNQLVEDLIDVSRLTRRQLAIVRAPAELADVIAQALELSAPAFEDRGHRLELSVPRGLVVDVDRNRIAQAFAKLLRNAARFTRAGGRIELAARELETRVEVELRDNGMGIPPELLPRLFEPCGRPSGERARGGLGVGLAIARGLVELHGGTIEAHSAGPGTGSRFTVSLPCWTSGAAQGEDTNRMATVTPRRILVVDDNEDAAWLLAEALRLGGHDVAVCHDGLEALEVAERHQPEIAFLDIGLPGLDGYQLCERLHGLASRPRMVAVTGYGQAGDRERAVAAGFDLHFVKPVSLRDVHEAIDALGSRLR